MYDNLFVHSSVDGHLSCFHILTIENRAATNIGEHVSFSIMVFSGYMPSSGIIREIQIKTIMREQLTPVGMAIIKKKSTNNKRWRGYGEKGNFYNCW